MTDGKGTVVITSDGEGLDSQTDPRFGRCQYFIITDGERFIASAGNTARALGNGAGIQAAEQLVGLKASVLITGDVGPNAFRVLVAAGIRVFVGCAGSVRTALSDYHAGKLREATAPTSPGHHGQGHGGMHGGRKDRP
jgi:predicted Fe-Mo cluster-binding NifX family protein